MLGLVDPYLQTFYGVLAFLTGAGLITLVGKLSRLVGRAEGRQDEQSSRMDRMEETSKDAHKRIRHDVSGLKQWREVVVTDKLAELSERATKIETRLEVKPD